MPSALKRITDFIIRTAEQGNAAEILPETSPGELGELERAVNRLVSELHAARQGKEKREAIDKELRLSRAIQSSLLPVAIPDIPGLEIRAIYRPAQEIGGDYYDFIEIDPTHLGIVIADVSGKSISGAMFMTITRNTIRSQAMLSLSPREVLQRAERLLVPSMMPGLFVSVFYAVLDLETMTLSCANAGHLPLLLFHFKEHRPDWVLPRGIAIGLKRGDTLGPAIEETELILREGDLAFFYTDGVTEAVDEEGEFFGRERIASIAQEAAAEGANHFLRTLEDRWKEFSGSQGQRDDVTAVAVGRNHGS